MNDIDCVSFWPGKLWFHLEKTRAILFFPCIVLRHYFLESFSTYLGTIEWQVLGLS
jgi:hypothetical protein